MIRTLAILFIAAASLLPLNAAFSQNKPEKPPDGTLALTQGSVAVGVGYSWGSGTLSYQGKNYPLKVKGLSLGQAGVAKVEAKGDVYNLAKLEDVSGNYTAAGIEGTVAGGVGATALRNQNGVVIYLTTTTRGLNFKVAVEGVEISLAQ